MQVRQSFQDGASKCKGPAVMPTQFFIFQDLPCDHPYDHLGYP